MWNLPAGFFSGNISGYMTNPYSGYFNGGLFSAVPMGMSSFSMFPSFNVFPSFSLFNFGFSNSGFSNSVTNYSGSTSSKGVKVGNKTQNLSFWKKLGYCVDAGVKLAKTAASAVVGWISKCAKYVKNAIARAGLGKYQQGHAYQTADILRKNPKFKEISPDGVNLKTLPAGCVLVYDRGKSGYSSRYGHTEITTGQGTAVSDGVTHNIRKPTAIFIPVST